MADDIPTVAVVLDPSRPRLCDGMFADDRLTVAAAASPELHGEDGTEPREKRLCHVS